MYDIVIIGAGPAGLTSAIYASRAGLNALVLEAKTYGGQIINTPIIENYPALPNVSGFEFSTKLYNQVKELGVEVKFEKAVKIEDDIDYITVTTPKNEYKAKTIILATGATNRRLKIVGEDRLEGHGISYCATCDGNFYRDKIVCVNGGGNTALEDAIYLSNIAKKVYLVHRRDEFRADKKIVDEAGKINNIEFILNAKIIKLIGENNLEEIVIEQGKNELNIKVDGLFIAIGQTPENENFKKLIEVDDKNYIVSDDCKTNNKRIFVAGDNRTKELRQPVTATNDGAIAVIEALKVIREDKKNV